MHINFLGGVRTVTGSMHLVEVNSNKVLLDCGMFQGRRKEAFIKNRNLPFSPETIDAVILGHAHVDHSGNIPSLFKNGYEGPIYTTHATEDLCHYMLPDSGHIQEKDVEYVNLKRKSQGKIPFEPLYTQQDAYDALNYFKGQSYQKEFQVTAHVKVIFHDAGHILGSALTELTLSENGRTIKLGYIVDLGRKNLPILRDPVVIPDLDYIIIESTYGGKLHDEIETAEQKLGNVIQQTIDRGGKIIIPSFALERTQEIVYALNNLWNKRKLPFVPVYVDSPLALNVTSVFKKHPECYAQKVMDVLQYDDDPFGFDKLSYVQSVEESKRINAITEPCIIISASGMCETGRILHHLRNNIEDPRNTILIVGFMAENTLGRKLVEKWSKVKIFGDEYTVRAQVVVMNAFSAHADRNDLINYVKNANTKLKAVFLVHGEESQCYALAEGLKDIGVTNVMAPQPGESIDI